MHKDISKAYYTFRSLLLHGILHKFVDLGLLFGAKSMRTSCNDNILKTDGSSFSKIRKSKALDPSTQWQTTLLMTKTSSSLCNDYAIVS